MKNKLLFAFAVISVILSACFTKYGMVYYFMSPEPFYHYGFPMRIFLVAPSDAVEYIYYHNIAINLLFAVPILASAAISLFQRRYQKTGSLLIAISGFAVIISLLLPWKWGTISAWSIVVLYLVWYLWFIFLISVILIEKKRG